MERIVIMSWHDSNMAGYEWVINVELSQRENNLFSLRAVQLEDTQDFASFMADVAGHLAEPYHRNDLVLLYRMNPKP
jgi:hypothetical protein